MKRVQFILIQHHKDKKAFSGSVSFRKLSQLRWAIKNVRFVKFMKNNPCATDLDVKKKHCSSNIYQCIE